MPRAGACGDLAQLVRGAARSAGRGGGFGGRVGGGVALAGRARGLQTDHTDSKGGRNCAQTASLTTTAQQILSGGSVRCRVRGRAPEVGGCTS